MRLYLSSFRVGGCPQRLLELVGTGRRAAVIANAMDEHPADIRAEGVDREVGALAELGFTAEELDLRDHRGAGTVGEVLRDQDVVWVRGGNVFVLRHALARSGADAELVRLLREDAIVYGGYSAGPCVLAPSLEGLEAVDDASAVERLYGEPPTWEGLGVLPYAIVPHVDSPDHPESEACDRVAEAHRRRGTAHRTLRDGEVLVVDGDVESVCR